MSLAEWWEILYFGRLLSSRMGDMCGTLWFAAREVASLVVCMSIEEAKPVVFAAYHCGPMSPYSIIRYLS